MRIGIVISTNDPETIWNTFRFANLCLNEMNEVTDFLNSKAVDYEKAHSEKFNIYQRTGEDVCTW